MIFQEIFLKVSKTARTVISFTTYYFNGLANITPAFVTLDLDLEVRNAFYWLQVNLEMAVLLRILLDHSAVNISVLFEFGIYLEQLRLKQRWHYLRKGNFEKI